jgi:hypothetical protein
MTYKENKGDAQRLRFSGDLLLAVSPSFTGVLRGVFTRCLVADGCMCGAIEPIAEQRACLPNSIHSSSSYCSCSSLVRCYFISDINQTSNQTKNED